MNTGGKSHFAAGLSFYTLIAVLTVVSLAPFYAMIVMGTYDSFQLFRFNGLPSDYILHNFATISKTEFPTFMKNSLVMSLSSVFFSLLASALCGYGFAKFRFKGNKMLYNLVLFTMMVPSQLSIVAYVYEMKLFHLNDSLVPSILPYVFAGFGVFWMTQYIKDIVPTEVLESARIDSAGEFRIFFSIVVPMITPAVITLGLLNFVWSWNSFFVPLVTINDSRLFTVPLGINSFNSLYYQDNGAKILALSIATMPVVLLYLIFSNRLQSGLTAGAVKA
ncbi:ABC transporter permease subunit [Cohnella sp. CFH 77786]|uniref:carbohydrate ABC transporter permease n=1 Tax=Cohnella sp. CFH 77786 TaxID=2662265 RepID=UPI001C60F75B|nr:carbohydrate ABC transporter permease [Cohnella sp. CFH 77786]MBW5448239.1 ABC transporter permease subunit [Cohnella sp. CFH 77786]